MIYVSFVSKNSPYEKVVEDYLIPTLKKFNLKYDIDYIGNRGSWIANIQYKPEFIRKMLLKHKQSIISLDADATIEKNPILFETIQDYDIAVHYLDWRTWYKKSYDKLELLGGTQYFAYNEKVLSLIEEWIRRQQTKVQWAQQVFQQLIFERREELKLYQLPISYCFIENDRHKEEQKDAVILHHQVSRKYRNRKF